MIGYANDDAGDYDNDDDDVDDDDVDDDDDDDAITQGTKQPYMQKHMYIPLEILP